MDGISMLGGEYKPASVDLTGLSPEEIHGISTSRINREQMMNQMIDRLSGLEQGRSTIAAQESARKLSEFKLQQEQKESEEVDIKDFEGNPFKVKRKDLTQSLKIMSDIKRDATQNKLNDEQLKMLQKTRPITADGKTFEISEAHYAAIAKAERDRKDAERVQTAQDALKGKTPAEMRDPKNFNNLMIANPGAATAIINRMLPEGDIGLTDLQYRYYADTNVNLINHLLKTKNPDISLVETANNLSNKLRDATMLLIVGKDTFFRDSKAVTVSLPPGVTADKVYKIAAERKMSVQDVLRVYYNESQEAQK